MRSPVETLSLGMKQLCLENTQEYLSMQMGMQ